MENIKTNVDLDKLSIEKTDRINYATLKLFKSVLVNEHNQLGLQQTLTLRVTLVFQKPTFTLSHCLLVPVVFFPAFLLRSLLFIEEMSYK